MSKLKYVFIIGVASAIALAIYYFLPAKGNSNYLLETTSDSPYFTFTENQHAALDDYFNSFTDKYGFNGTFLVGQRDSVFYSNAFGFSDYSKKDSLTLNSAFQLASVSKQFTAVCILKLYQEGKISLQDTIQKYIPDFPYEGITIHQLLVHRSGLPNYHYFFQHIPTTSDTLLNNALVLNEINEKKPGMYFHPNRKFQYSNTGYALLASIVEIVSGKSFSVYVEQEIFKPLGMKSSFAYRADKNELYPAMVTGYLRRWRLAEDNYLDGVLGDKGIYSSVNDLFIWDQSLYKGLIVHPDTINLAFNPMGRPLDAKVNYGYGWRMYAYGADSIKVIFHFGWWHGFRSMLMHIPKDSTTIVALKNRSAGKMMNTKSIMKILYPQVDSLPIIDSLDVE